MTQTKPAALHQFEGRDVQRATVKITNAGDGLSDALAIDPEEIELEEGRPYVLQTQCVRVSIETDKNGVTSRVHTMKTVGISPIDDAVAQKAIAEFKEETQRRRDEVDGQTRFDDERAAEAAEALDKTGTPAEVAQSAADRAKSELKSPFEKPAE